MCLGFFTAGVRGCQGFANAMSYFHAEKRRQEQEHQNVASQLLIE